MTLTMNVHMLTSPHVARDQQGRYGTAQPLLKQLTAEAVTRGESVGSEKPLPIGIKAVALWQDMEREARNHQYARTGDSTGGLWQITESWRNVEDDEWTPYLEHVTSDWIARITNVIDPPRPRRPLRQPCVACGERWVYDADGVRSEAVTAWVWDEEGGIAGADGWDVSCASCSAQWVGNEVANTYWRAVA